MPLIEEIYDDNETNYQGEFQIYSIMFATCREFNITDAAKPLLV